MASKPIALELADALGKNGENCTCCAYASFECCCKAVWGSDYTQEAAFELRRLHADNERLREALKDLLHIPKCDGTKETSAKRLDIKRRAKAELKEQPR